LEKIIRDLISPPIYIKKADNFYRLKLANSNLRTYPRMALRSYLVQIGWDRNLVIQIVIKLYCESSNKG